MKDKVEYTLGGRRATFYLSEEGMTCTHKIPPCDLPLWAKDGEDGGRALAIIQNICIERDYLKDQLRKMELALDLACKEKLEASKACPPPKQYTFMGMHVIVNPHCDKVPNMSLSPKILEIIGPYNPQFCIDMQNWMVDFFGTTDNVYVSGNTLNIGPRTRDKMIAMGQLK